MNVRKRTRQQNRVNDRKTEMTEINDLKDEAFTLLYLSRHTEHRFVPISVVLITSEILKQMSQCKTKS